MYKVREQDYPFVKVSWGSRSAYLNIRKSHVFPLAASRFEHCDDGTMELAHNRLGARQPTCRCTICTTAPSANFISSWPIFKLDVWIVSSNEHLFVVEGRGSSETPILRLATPFWLRTTRATGDTRANKPPSARLVSQRAFTKIPGSLVVRRCANHGIAGRLSGL